MKHRSSLSIFSLLFLFTISGFAQDYRGRIEGIVTDQTKSVIAGSTVTLRNVNTGIKIIHQSSDTGLYLFDLVDPGSYSITVEQPGFGTFVQENCTENQSIESVSQMFPICLLMHNAPDRRAADHS